MKKIAFGNFGTSKVSARAFIAANYIQDTGYVGVSIDELKAYLNRNFSQLIDDVKMQPVLSRLESRGYAIMNNRIYQSIKYVK